MIPHRIAFLVACAVVTVIQPGWTRETSAVACTPRDLSWLQTDTAGWMIAVALGDSAVAGWPDGPGWADPQPIPASRRSRVYGQWATVEQSSDPRAVASRVLVVRWGLGSLCEPTQRDRALGFDPGTRFFAGGSLRPGNARNAVHDITTLTPTYSGTGTQQDSADAWVTVDEYVAFYRAMPTKAQWFDNPVAHARAIRRWARQNSSVAARQPVRVALEMMETDYAIAMDNRRDDGRWSQDSLIQEPGSILRPGMTLLYRGDSDQLWTIDSLSPDTTLADVPHCVRMRLRLAPQSPATTRAFCAREGVLHSYNAATGQLRPARPLLPRQRLAVAGPNRTTLLFQTDSLDVQMAGGHAFDLVFTTVTTSDSTGRVVRRLRESFAPALLTATEGIFEVPDSTQADGWRIVSRFRLADINP